MSIKSRIKPSLYALGRRSVPPTVVVEGESFVLDRIFKNDFFAVTSVYRCGDRAVLLKINRQARFLGFPLRWIGRILACKEMAALTALQDTPGVPRLIARWENTGLIREFIPGHALQKGEWTPDDFHENLRRLVHSIHAHGMAYVDLEKCENVLVDDSGRPWLFDFQISWYWPSRWGGELAPIRWVRRWFQQGDLYHLRKIQRRTRKDQLSEVELAESFRRPWYIRLHNASTRPFTRVRRAILLWLFGPKTAPGERGRVAHDSPSSTAAPQIRDHNEPLAFALADIQTASDVSQRGLHTVADFSYATHRAWQSPLLPDRMGG